MSYLGVNESEVFLKSNSIFCFPKHMQIFLPRNKIVRKKKKLVRQYMNNLIISPLPEEKN